MPRAATSALAGHDLHFTVGENVGTARCPLPDRRLRWRPIRQPVVLDRWPVPPAHELPRFTTVASWRGAYGPVELGGRTYGLKAHEFRRFADLPRAPGLPFEVALDIHPADAADARPAAHGQAGALVRPATRSPTPDGFRALRARLRRRVLASRRASTWRRAAAGSATAPCATWPAAARRSCRTPASADTCPVGEGLARFRDAQEAARRARAIVADYAATGAAARRIAEEHFAPGAGARAAARRQRRSRRERSLRRRAWWPACPRQGGATWAVLQYVLGLRALGHDVLLVEPVERAAALARRTFARGRAPLRPAAARVDPDSAATVGARPCDECSALPTAPTCCSTSPGMLTDEDAARARSRVRAFVDLDPAFTQLWHAAEGARPRASTATTAS